MIRVDSSCFYSNDLNEQSQNNTDRFQSTISFGGDIQQNIQVNSNQNECHFSYQNKASLMQIFNCYLKNSQLQYTLNCSSFQGNALQEQSNFISQKDEINQVNSKNPSQQNFIKPKSTNLIKFSQIAKKIQSLKSPKNAQKLTFKSNIISMKQQQKNPIKIEDRQNINPNLSSWSKQNQKPHQKICPEEFLQLQSKVQWTDKENETKLKRKRSIKNLSLSRKEKLLSPYKTINPQSKSSNIKNIHLNSIFKDNQTTNKVTICGLEFSKKYKKRALKNKSKGLETNNDKNIQQAQFLR